MKTFNYTLTDPLGIHARPAGLLVLLIKKYSSSVKITGKGKTADGRRLIAVMGLGVKAGDEITLEIEGEDEASLAEALKDFFKKNL